MQQIKRSIVLILSAVIMAAALGSTAVLAQPVPKHVPGDQGPFGPGRVHHPLLIKVHGVRSDGSPKLTTTAPSGLPPQQIESVYGLTPGTNGGSGQIIAIVDAYHDPNALRDLNTFSSQYGLPTLSTCSSLTQVGACFLQAEPQGRPSVNSGWVLEESLDIEWAHAEAPGAKIVLVEAADNSLNNLFGAIGWANDHGATQVSLSWDSSEYAGETSADTAYLAHAGTSYTVAAGDNGNGAAYPATSPNALAVGGTTLNGCGGTSCSFSSETAWSGSGGGVSAYEALPGYQSSYSGAVSGASSIAALTNGFRGFPDVAFDGDPNTGVSVFDSTSYSRQSGWWTLGGTSVGAPNWAGIIASGASSGASALQSAGAIYSTGYTSNLTDITYGTNGSCGTDCSAGKGYDLVTGLGSPLNYPSAPTAPAPDFSLSANPASGVSFTSGGSASFIVSVTPANGFSGAVTLAASQPAGLSVTPSSATSSPNYAPATFNVFSTSPGTYSVTVTGTSGALTHQVTVDVTVTPSASTDFTLSANPPSQTVKQRSTTSYNVTLTAQDGFSNSVQLSVSGLPRGSSASFSSSAIVPTASGAPSTLTVQTGRQTGTFTLTITGTGGGRQHSAQVQLVVVR